MYDDGYYFTHHYEVVGIGVLLSTQGCSKIAQSDMKSYQQTIFMLLKWSENESFSGEKEEVSD